jgi:ubiquinone/menaquinone biosynthesis C-methylase UbiE
MNTTQATHNEQIVDQFTKQAVPFSNKAAHSNEDAMRLTIETIGLVSTDTVLDVACGPGIVACAFAPVAHHVTGIDLVPAMIERAKQFQAEKGLSNLDWRVGDVLPLPFEDGTFSVVVSRYAFHHFVDPKAVLAEMVRVCAPHGKVAVVDFAVSPENRVAFDTMEQLRDPSHTVALTLDELVEALESENLVDVQTKFYGVEIEVEKQLAASFPKEGDAVKFRKLVSDDVNTNKLGINARFENEETHYTYPIAIVVGKKQAE